ncbi:hypothetical protein OS31_34030 [Dickeya oryzae]
MRLNTLQQQIASYCHHYLADLHVGKLPIEFTLHKLAKKINLVMQSATIGGHSGGLDRMRIDG